MAYVPAWWRKGWPRGRAGSVAEVELLSELAMLLMPRTDIGELFRSFPATEGWGGHALEPDLAAYGVLKDRNAALFVEYDGFWRHGEKEGIAMDRKKNAALMAYAPKGSFVVRIAHKVRKPLLQRQILWIQVSAWRQGDKCSLSKSLHSVIAQMVTGLQQVIHPRIMTQFQLQLGNDQWTFSDEGRKFVVEAAVRAGKNSSQEVSKYFANQGFGQREIGLMESRIKSDCHSIEGKIRPKISWLLQLGLSKMQVAKAVATFPQIIGYSVQQNLEPTVEWLKNLGLSKMQVAKAVAAFPQILGCSVQQNLKPTVEWLKNLGLSKMQVAKAVATSPQILGYSVQQNLEPTVEWLKNLGLSKMQVAKAVAAFPHILGYSVQQNLKPTVEWLKNLGLSKMQVAKAVAKFSTNSWP